MRLRRFLLRYYPPGLILEFEAAGGQTITRTVDLLSLSEECAPRSSDAEQEVSAILRREPAITEARRPQVRTLVHKLQRRLSEREVDFTLHAQLKAHLMPLTRCAFSKNGERLATGSYDCTCKVWDTAAAEEALTLQGHDNAVYCVAFNNPFADRIFTGSFDHTARVWDAVTGDCCSTLCAHRGEITCLSFEPRTSTLATGALDQTIVLWDVETAQQRAELLGHTAEIVSLQFDNPGDKLLTASFDGTARIWDLRTGLTVRVLEGHKAEVSGAVFDFPARTIATGSIDHSVRLWDTGSGRCMQTLELPGEVVDLCFNAAGTRLAAAGGCEAWVLDPASWECVAVLQGHCADVSQVAFNPRGTRILTGSADGTARLWSSQSGDSVQHLSSHSDEVLSCAFNYEGDALVTASKDNTCNIWRAL